MVSRCESSPVRVVQQRPATAGFRFPGLTVQAEAEGDGRRLPAPQALPLDDSHDQLRIHLVDLLLRRGQQSAGLSAT